MARPVKILVLQFASIGDVVLTTPVVRCLTQQIPNSVIHFCTERPYQSIVEYSPFITQAHFIDQSLYKLIRELRAEQFDYVIDLQNTFLTSLIKAALGSRSYSIEKQSFREWLYVRWKVNAMPDQHIVDRYMATVLPLGVENDGLGLDYFIPYKDEVEIDWLPETHQHGFVAYAIGGQSLTRRLPVLRMIELCLKINYPVILLGDKADRKVGDELMKAIGERQIYNACGLYNLNQSASLLQRARVVFSHDTGLMHIAAAFRKKVYSIWGSTTPRFGFYPYKTPHVRLETPGLGCRPCSATNADNCPMKHFKCMNNLPFDFEVKELRTKKNFE
ncbi:glycosyltransferase family 9 protein [Spirosoma sp. KCTC 42546]|uniref:glycosyltransferase family 9 protein n=1 Tax=Spirosoma sp. KCTC 42546 TaxID=2520506 RepID=UPI0011587A16|nr:glycosyltransferase family 9 protein [Spirosoma sp. KCTC 42546]QDK80564.1 glycosyltransferase family 9 protein [Spirosoma sp. KCTC 42546]